MSDLALFTDSNSSSLEGIGVGCVKDADSNTFDSASTATIRMLDIKLVVETL